MRIWLAWMATAALAGMPSESYASEQSVSEYLAISSPCIIPESLPAHFKGHDPGAFVQLLSRAKTTKDQYESATEYDARMLALPKSLSQSPAHSLCFLDEFSIATYDAETQTLSVSLEASDHSGLRDINGKSQKLVFVELELLRATQRVYEASVKEGTVMALDVGGEVIRLATSYDEFFLKFGKKTGVKRREARPEIGVNASLHLEIRIPGMEAKQINEREAKGDTKRLSVMHVVRLKAPYYAETKERKAPRSILDSTAYSFDEQLIMVVHDEIVVFDNASGRILSRLK